MQTIWSRVAQAGLSCRCPQCLRSAHAVTRRTTASAASRLPRFFGTSTILYTTVITTAATIDGLRKRERREQWDDAISDLKSELVRLEEASAQEESARHEPALRDDHDEIGTFASTYDPNLDLFQLLQPSPDQVVWPQHDGPRMRTHYLPPQSIYAHPVSKKKAMGTRYSPKKIETIQLSMDLLCYQFAMDLISKGLHPQFPRSVPAEFLERLFLPVDVMQMQIQAKKTRLHDVEDMNWELANYYTSMKEVRLCHYEQDENGEFHESVSQLNDALIRLFVAFRAQGASHLVGDLICNVAYNLCTASAPPNIATYNALLVGFSSIECCHHLVEYVVASLRATHMRPNEITLEAVLRYYIQTDNPKGFVWFYNLMRGEGRGLMVVRPDIREISPFAANRVVWKHGNSGGKLLQLPNPSPSVFAAVLQGVMKFSGLDAALRMHEIMKRQGWGLGVHGHSMLLRECALLGRWDEGLAAWRQLWKLCNRSALNHEKSRAEKISERHVGWMLRLCEECQQPEMYRQVWGVARDRLGWSERSLLDVIEKQGLEPPVHLCTKAHQADRAKVDRLPEELLRDCDATTMGDWCSVEVAM